MFVTNRYARFIYQLLKTVLTLPLYFIGYVIPQKKEIWIFGHTHGYIDNPRYLYEFLIVNRQQGVRPVWITKKKNDTSIAGENYYYLSLLGLYLQYRASVACIATGSSDVAQFTLARKKIVQLWHGIPIKKLLLDSPETSPFPIHWKVANKVFYRLLRAHLSKYDLLIAVNKHNQACLSRAFGLPQDKIKITGLPRHDVILSGGKNEPTNRILYAPTWHPSILEAKEKLNAVLSTELIEYCIQENITIDISIHPNNAQLKEMQQNNSVFRILTKQDINMELTKYDILITDYSSIALDFSILNKPVIFCCHDIDKYREERGIYDFFFEIIKKKNTSCDGVVSEIKSIKESNVSSYNFYGLKPDGKARMRIVNEIKKLL